MGYHVAVMKDGYSRKQLEALSPNSGRILEIEQDPNEPEMQAVIVTAQKSGIYDFISR